MKRLLVQLSIATLLGSGPALAGEPPADAAKDKATASKDATASKGDAAEPAAPKRRAIAPATLSQLRQIPELSRCVRNPIDVKPLAANKPKAALSAADLDLQKERLAYEKTVERFTAVGEDYREEVAAVLDRSFEGRRKKLSKRYEKRAAELEVEERSRRNDAIARFEKFVAKYPNDATHTPDAMFRLAELYYERSAIDYADASDRHTEQMALYERGKIPAEPQSPTRDYSDSVRLYQTLLGRFGDTYRYADAVYYLLGYVLQESADDLEARKAWIALVDKHPKSEYAPEVFLRIGENHFDYGEFQEAASVYKRALAYTDSRFYDKALYKLAWTYFQMYDYDQAIRTFKQLIAWYDTSSDGGSATASALREEAIDYLAKSLAEDDWDNDGIEDDNRGVPRALAYLSEGNSYENDIVAAYAASLYDLHDKKKYAEAVSVYRELIDRDPNALKAVEHQQQIIKIYDILRDIDSATRERQKLADMFAPGSKWARANRQHGKKVADASTAVENAMRKRALFLHQRAQELKAQATLDGSDELLDQSLAHYKKASKAYHDYLAKYPKEPASYEMRFYLAESYYYSLQFDKAADAYLGVAQEPHQARFREPSAWSAVKSYERLLVEATENKSIPDKSDPNQPYDPPELDTPDGDKVRKVVAEQLPDPVKQWLSATDFYVLRDIKRDGSRLPQAKLAYQSADLLYRFRHFDDARERYKQVIACFPQDEVAAFAMANIINSYREENNFTDLEKWLDVATKLKLGDKETRTKFETEIKAFKLGAQFQRAESLLEAKRYLEAAREFERLADQNQGAKFLDKAYYNAAVAYKEVKYYDSASRIFEKLVTDPRFQKSEFKEDSLFELAENYKLFFNFEKATSTYLTYYNRTASSNAENRPYALFTAAKLLEYSGDLSQAASTYRQYATAFGDRSDASNALYRAAALYEKLKERDEQKRVLETFISKYENDQGMAERVLQSMVKLGELSDKGRSKRAATNHYKDVIREFDVRGLQPGSSAAAAAAQAKFTLVERRFEQYLKIRLTGTSQRKMAADLGRKKKLLDELELAYGEILPYKSLDWTIAAFFRLGDIYRDFAQTLYQAPPPSGLSDEEMEIFITQIEDEGLKYENVAIERFEKTVGESRRLKVTNDWAKRALEAINKYKPEEYPLYKETKRTPTFAPIYRLSTPEEVAP